MSFETNKILGEIGALLMVIGPFAGAYTAGLALIGFIMLIVAFYGLSDYYKERGIFNNALFGGIIFLVGGAVAVGIIISAAVGVLSLFGFELSNWSNPAYIQNFNWQSFTNFSALLPYIGAVVGAVVIFFVLAIIAAFLARRSFVTLAQKSGTGMFATAGTLLFVGAILTIASGR